VQDYPAALGGAVLRAAQVVGDVPLNVTESGIATADDARRIAFTAEALDSLRAALDDGVDVHGYLHWSLLDNYEWGSYPAHLRARRSGPRELPAHAEALAGLARRTAAMTSGSVTLGRRAARRLLAALLAVQQGNAALRYLRTMAGRFGGDRPGSCGRGFRRGADRQLARRGADQRRPGCFDGAHRRGTAGRRARRGAVLRPVRHEHRGRDRVPYAAHLPVGLHRCPRLDLVSGIGQLSTTRHITARYPPAFLSLGDADPFRSQTAELLRGRA